MLYKKINLELIVPADEADAVVTDLNAALDRIEERHTLYGGGTETVLIELSGSGGSQLSRIHWRPARSQSARSILRATA